jgi:hypothetical protein
MSAAGLLTRLYPPAVRERWGAEIGHEVTASGVRSWPDTLVGAGRLWLRPGDWPETAPGQTHRVLVVAVFTVAAVTALLLRAAEPPSTSALPATSLCLALILAGAVAAAPLPTLCRPVWRTVIGDAVHVLAVPAVAALTMLLVANSGLVEHPTGALRVALIGWYWSTLVFTAVRLCTFVARLARTCRTPGRGRIRGALLLIGAGLVLTAAQSAAAAASTAPAAGHVVLTVALGLLGAATISAGQDLRAPLQDPHAP